MNPLYRNDRPGQFPDSWYAASTDLPDSRPPLQGSITADVCIVGAGYTGLSAALYLAEKGLDVVVLDAHRAGFGASGRNGGQVHSGFNMGQRALSARYGAGLAKELWMLAEEAKDDLRANCRTIAQDARYTPGIAHGFYAARELAEHREERAFYAAEYGYDQVEIFAQDAFRDIVRSPRYVGGQVDMGGGHLHPLRYVLALARAAEAAGARIFEGTEVHHIAQGDPAVLRCGKGRVTAAHVILAGNGYLPNISRAVAAKVMPINSFICATEPLGARAAEVLARDIAVADSKFVVNYYRMSDDRRLLFGGRESYSIAFPKDIRTALVSRMTALFPQLVGARIDYVWGGTLGITVPRLPALQRVAPNVLSAAGFSGQGVAIAGLAGKAAAAAIAGQASRFDTLTAMKVPNFPGGPALRAPILTLAMTWFALRDRLGI